ncbi:12959_t:CDS:2 [Funneliformis mosseae]|uniref:12959_t:CDS:1 n=1 Tax=Funneliformis mosseae TaxID=27381 RepID=A0A9N8Z1L2_FUNMO|nr:12959_t:CDS:2 [Funneliformis mosseae]
MSNNNISIEEYNSLPTKKETVAAQSNTAISVAAITEALETISLMTENNRNISGPTNNTNKNSILFYFKTCHWKLCSLSTWSKGMSKCTRRVSYCLLQCRIAS